MEFTEEELHTLKSSYNKRDKIDDSDETDVVRFSSFLPIIFINKNNKAMSVISKKQMLELATPCDGAPSWSKAPKPSNNPLDTMKWATETKKDRFGCTRTNADGTKKFHAGIDIKASIGTDCFATEDAVVTDVGSGLDLGCWVAISFTKDGKKYGVAYCHLSKQIVKNGDKVKKGQKIGETGVSGNAEVNNPHLHLEVQDQVWVAYGSPTDRSKHGLDPNNYINTLI